MSTLVTGGTKGIGFEIARRLAQPGSDIFLNFLQDQQSATRAYHELIRAGAVPHLIQGDVGTPEGARKIIRAVSEKVNHIDHIIHCAVRVLTAPLLTVDLDAFTQAINLNGTSIVYLVQAAKPLLRPGSSIIFLSSRGSRTVVPNYAALGAAKALAEALVRYLVPELAPLGIRINCIAPGTVDTEALRQIFQDKTQEYLDREATQNPSGRNIDHADYTSVAAFLISPAASMIQGQVIFVNGGAYLAP
jgi:enoyl-[acyl-carrier protein] reductase III